MYILSKPTGVFLSVAKYKQLISLELKIRLKKQLSDV